MRVLFDAYWWQSGPAALRHIMREIIFAWETEFPDDELVLLVRRRHAESVRLEAPRRASLISTSLRPQAVLAAIGTARVAKSVQPDVILTHNFASLAKPSVVFIQDVLFRTNPEWFTRKERAYYSLMAPLARRASAVLASSVEEGRRIEREVRPRHVRAVGIGISEELLAAKSTRPDLPVHPGSYVLSVGRLNVRKNLARACIGCLEQGILSPDRPLVVVGAAHGAADSQIDSRIEAAERDGSIIFSGFLDDGHLRWLYENARVLVYPSLGEGFGMPPMEAMAFGTPVVAGDIPVMRENLGSLGHFVDPLDPDAIGRAVMAAVESDMTSDIREQLRRHGRRFTWSSVVRSIREVCSKVEESARIGTS